GKGEGKGMGMGMGEGMGKGGKPGGRSKNPGPGRRDFARTPVYGDRPDDTKSNWKSLSNRERGALSENFARELPREYREMLKAYYDTISKQ
ncbi:MAG: hypothetical protein K8T25_08865, partial [Planctomycetia bacterium]|nr:hypothetical protein [Planctomycetia bacterium]